MIYDCPANLPGLPPQPCTDVLRLIREAAAAQQVDSWAITFSTGAKNPGPGNLCNSVFGESGLVFHQSQYESALDGPAGWFGKPLNSFESNGLTCGGSLTGMISLGKRYDKPRVIDFHTYPCINDVNGACDPNVNVSGIAQTMYSSLWSLVKSRGRSGSRVVIGETHANQDHPDDEMSARVRRDRPTKRGWAGRPFGVTSLAISTGNMGAGPFSEHGTTGLPVVTSFLGRSFHLISFRRWRKEYPQCER